MCRQISQHAVSLPRGEAAGRVLPAADAVRPACSLPRAGSDRRVRVGFQLSCTSEHLARWGF